MAQQNEIYEFILGLGEKGATSSDVAHKFHLTLAQASTRLWRTHTTFKAFDRHVDGRGYRYVAKPGIKIIDRRSLNKGNFVKKSETVPEVTPGSIQLEGSLESMIDALASSLADRLVARFKALLPAKLKGLFPDAAKITQAECASVSVPEHLVVETFTKADVPMPSSVEAVAVPCASHAHHEFDDDPPAPSDSVVPLQPKNKPIVRPRIGVVGLLSQQAGLIASEFHAKYDFRFWNGGAQKELRQLGHNCEVVFLMTKWCSHSVTDSLKACGANYRIIPGGMDSLRLALSGYEPVSGAA